MHLQFFTIPIHGGAEAAVALNQFLSSHRIIAIDRHSVPDGSNSAWCVYVSFVGADAARAAVPGKRPNKLDDREILNEQDFAIFARLRSLLLSRRRRRRYCAARRGWEQAYLLGQIDPLRLQAGLS